MKMKFLTPFLFAMLLIVTIATGCAGKNTIEDFASDFWNAVAHIQEDFEYGTYTEIMEERSLVLGLPETCHAITESDNFIVEQKLFVYKNPDEPTVFLLQMALDASGTNCWNTCLSYDSDTFNSSLPTAYGDFVAERIPDVEFASISFTYSHCTYTVICLSEKSETDHATKKVLHFTNSLINFVTAE